MGTDIHLIAEHKKNGKWERVDPPEHFPRDPWILKQIAEFNGTDEQRNDPNGMYAYYVEKRDHDWYSHRNYKLFAILANVRNGAGFAGIKTGEGYNPISKPRGLPKDCSCYNAWEGDPGDGREPFSFGDHSYSWFTLKELLDYDWTQTTRNCGIVSWETYKKRKTEGVTGEPDTYSGGHYGPGVVVYEEDEVPDTEPPEGENRFVQIWWDQTYAESAYSFYTDVIPCLQTIDPNPENVRIVFGFDS